MDQVDVWRRRLLAAVAVLFLLAVSGALLDFVMAHVHDRVVVGV
jgi:hypothetical protein